MDTLRGLQVGIKGSSPSSHDITCVELDQDNGKEGHDLDEFNSHRFLEQIGETKVIIIFFLT